MGSTIMILQSFLIWNLAHDEDDVSTTMSQSGSPNSNSSNHSGRDSPLPTSLPYSSHNKKQLNNKRYTNETKTTSNTCNTKKRTNKVIHKKDDNKKHLTDESSSENSDFDERNSEREREDECQENFMDNRKFIDDNALEKVIMIYIGRILQYASNRTKIK